ncbi:ABC transporter permease [Rhizobium sp. CNPSo 3968]|uniref:ABC transporter permease n=1 Tax=Rhizobium sp. CNPSo 3968 TaxID=3021408 RepID=UPI00254A7ABE|nr:ABC transporter permease [Rhizobium sp. CNPSo 3968]MDK4719463.1 ABC transporter permease [Rhizobium sp. CNPSo 3968]
MASSFARQSTGTFRRGILTGSVQHYSPLLAILLILPLLLLLAGGFVYPVARLIGISLSGEAPLAPYQRVFDSPLYIQVLLRTFRIAAIVTVACFAIGYPTAYAIARMRGKLVKLGTACLFIPLWTSVLVRSYAWIVLLGRNGIINDGLIQLGVISTPLKMLYTEGAVILAMTHVLMPFMILPIHSALRSVPSAYEQAARNLGASRIAAFWRVTFPLSLSGVFAGCVICFILAIGFYITPALVGGPGALMMATLIGQQTIVLLDWPFAAALSVILLSTTLLLVLLFRRALSFSKGLNSVH